MAKPYAEAPLWQVLDTLARNTMGPLTVSELATRILSSGGYPAAYDAIGRLVAAGYADYSAPAQGFAEKRRVGIALTPAGKVRWSHGPGYPQATVAAWRRGQEDSPRSTRWRHWHRLR